MRLLELDWKMAVWFGLALVVGACFGGDFAQGLPCESAADCGPRVRCIEGFCGGLGDPALCGNGLRDVGEQCDDGNVNDSDGCSADCLLPAVCGNGVVQAGEACDDGNAVEKDDCTTNCALSPEVPTLELSFAQVKQFEFSWEPVLGADYYQLFERADADAKFMQVDGDIEGHLHSLTVPLHFRVNASYKLYACNALRCVASDAVDVVGNLAEAVGYLKASNTDFYDRFGISAALSGDGNTLAVGADGEDSHSTGIDGDQDDDSAQYAGAVYVFVRTGGGWSQQAYVKASNTGSSDRFGFVVALSGDGNTLVVGADGEDSHATGINGEQDDDSADGSGAVYVFVRTGESWSQQAYVKASNTGADDLFGFSVALSGDGNTLAVGAYGEGSHATGINGDQDDDSVVAGAVYVFVRTGESWSQQAYVKASNTGADDLFGDQFGLSVALSGDGNTLAVGADGEDSHATGINGEQDDDSTQNAGAVYVFVRGGESWSQQAYVKASNTDANDYFGLSVALSRDGNTLAVGATGEDSDAAGINGDVDDESADGAGAVYVFVRTGGSWSQQAYVKASNAGANDIFGLSLALSGDGNTLAVGAYWEGSNATGIDGDQDDDSAERAGAVYVFVRTGAVWSQQTYVKASHTIKADEFGIWVSLSEDGTALAVGATKENYGTTGVGNQTDIAAFDAGAVYLY